MKSPMASKLEHHRRGQLKEPLRGSEQGGKKTGRNRQIGPPQTRTSYDYWEVQIFIGFWNRRDSVTANSVLNSASVATAPHFADWNVRFIRAPTAGGKGRHNLDPFRLELRFFDSSERSGATSAGLIFI